MLELDKRYSAKNIESQLIDRLSYKSSIVSKVTPYTIIMPPPNITGILHMGHVLNLTIQDVLLRRAKMQGKNICWVPGLDHAAISTEAKVIDYLKKQSIDKNSLSREEFLKYVWEWKEKYGGIILTQIKRLGVCCDWDRLHFTLDNDTSKGVINFFIHLYEKGLIYKDTKMIHWDPVNKTALSDVEVIYKDTKASLYYVKYSVVGSDEYIVVATSRPETIPGDVAICINPNDSRYVHLKGKHVIVPIVNREIPIIFDDYVDMEFGTGCLKVTPAHDINDYNLGLKHNLPVIEVIAADGTLTMCYPGMDRFKARKQIINDITEAGLLDHISEYETRIGHSERTNAVVEPRISKQWFVKMETLAKPALEHVLNGTIKFHPDKFVNMYQSWLENIHDWCISRQLWWGHQIPAYYLPNGEVVVAHDIDEALRKANDICPGIKKEDLTQDPDVLDTWFSSALWPMSVFDGICHPNNDDFKYYYPTDLVVTAPDIIFFWITRMIITGYELTNKPPFKDVYFTGTIRDDKGRKMSKSLGNSPDPLLLFDQYGADAVRLGILINTQAGNDLKFSEQMCVQGRNFLTKLWNALRLITIWEQCVGDNGRDETNAINKFNDKLNETKRILDEKYKQYKINEVAISVYKLVWDEFCSTYLEIIKPEKGGNISSETLNKTKYFYDELINILHPLIPFYTTYYNEFIKQNMTK